MSHWPELDRQALAKIRKPTESLQLRDEPLHDAQLQVKAEAQRFNVVNCGRRWGKTWLGEDMLLDPKVLTEPTGWFSPTYKFLVEAWRDLRFLLKPITERSNVQERRIELVTGGILEMWSLDNPDAGRGRKYRRIVVDEAALVKDLLTVWNKVLRSTLADLSGDAWFLSTPKGHNGFWQLYQWGLDEQRPDWQCWQLPTSTNPFIPAAEIEEMRQTLPQQIYAQEVLAEFIDDAGGVFRGVLTAVGDHRAAAHPNGSEYVFGVDWGKLNDFTVITVLDVNEKKLVYMDRFNQIDYHFQRQRLLDLYRKFQPYSVIVERNSIGEPNIEELLNENVPVEPFTTTNASKKQAIEALSLAIERQDLTLLNDPVLIAELQAYQAERLPSGMIRYNAPAGLHDDTVMSLALAWQAVADQTWLLA